MPDRILLIEDSADDALFFGRAFKKSGVRNSLTVVRDGLEALDYLAGTTHVSAVENIGAIGLIFLDLQLPGVAGLDVLHALRCKLGMRDVIVVVLSSSDHPRDVKRAYEHGANSFLTKPSDPGELSELLKITIDYWMNRNVRAIHS